MADLTGHLLSLRDSLHRLFDRITDTRIARAILHVDDVLDHSPQGDDDDVTKLTDLTARVAVTQATVPAADLTALLNKIEKFLDRL